MCSFTQLAGLPVLGLDEEVATKVGSTDGSYSGLEIQMKALKREQ